jgi:hypothetical protein
MEFQSQWRLWLLIESGRPHHADGATMPRRVEPVVLRSLSQDHRFELPAWPGWRATRFRMTEDQEESTPA